MTGMFAKLLGAPDKTNVRRDCVSAEDGRVFAHGRVRRGDAKAGEKCEVYYSLTVLCKQASQK